MGGDTYRSFAELAAAEKEWRDYRIRVARRPGSRVAIIAPHGGRIEDQTSRLAGLIAGADFNLYTFNGRKVARNWTLHITSQRFDEPRCLALLRECDYVVAVHGCRGDHRICLGGLDQPLIDEIGQELKAAGLPLDLEEELYTAQDPRNVCNRGVRGRGVQIEISNDIRADHQRREVLAAAVSRAIHQHIAAVRSAVQVTQ